MDFRQSKIWTSLLLKALFGKQMEESPQDRTGWGVRWIFRPHQGRAFVTRNHLIPGVFSDLPYRKSHYPCRQSPCIMGFFDEAYRGTPPWDIGRAQRELIALEEAGEIRGSVLDVGCGKGDNALFLAEKGYHVWAVDAVPSAIEAARKKATERSIPVTFMVMDILSISGIGQTFDTVIDSGFFHTLTDPVRHQYTRELSLVLKPGGNYFMLAFSDREPPGYGPRRVTQDEIRATFSSGWQVNWIKEAVFESRTRPGGSRAWLSSIKRI